MSESSDAKDDESPMQRALRLKKAAQAAKGRSDGAIKPRQAAAMPQGASKPWTKK